MLYEVITTLQLTVKQPSTSNESLNICSNELPIFWHNMTINSAGIYQDTLKNIIGCDSIVTLNLKVKSTSQSISTRAVCSLSLPFDWNGMQLTTAGTYSAHLTNSEGCDSIAILNFAIENPLRSTTNINICTSELPYLWNNNYYYDSGTYEANFQNTDKCDSIATLNLIVSKPTSSQTITSICEGDTCYFNGEKYTTSGKYTFMLTNVNGCDSTANLILTVNKPSSSITEVEVGLSGLPYQWNDTSYTRPGEHISKIKFTNCVGCDSIPILILKVDAPNNSISNISICAGETYWFNGNNYNLPGTYTYHAINSMGSDSTVILNLTVNPTYNVSQKIELFSGETYSINGNKYSTAGTYTDVLKTTLGCDSTVVTELSYINIPNTLTPNGDGMNDIFMKDFHIQIYNRNGIILYDGTDGWNGTFHNRPVSKDTYFYVLHYTRGNEAKTKDGFLMVLP